MLKNFVKLFSGDPTKKTVAELGDLAVQINLLEPEFQALSDEALCARTDEFRARVAELVGNVDGLEEKEQLKAQQDALDELMPEVFATVREASKRTIGLRPYDVQLIGGAVLHRGQIAEMKTGEGKTLVATLPIYLNALLGKGIHLITVNDYLARRDARWMAPIFHMLGLSVGVLQMAATTENGKKAFLVDFERVRIKIICVWWIVSMLITPMSPTAQTRSLALIICATTWPCDSKTACNAVIISPS
jgi:preprotein translocase subunit SecA